MKFLFDLDGTITRQETLPLIAEHVGLKDKITELTKETVQGNIPFIESFIRRVNILGSYPVEDISILLEGITLYEEITKFISLYPAHCVVVTGNLDCWCERLLNRIGCQSFCSHASLRDGKVNKLEKILLKENVVDMYKSQGETVVFIGDGNNDLEAMRHSDISIATGLTHNPANSLLSICDYLIFDENTLCRQLNQLL